MRRIRGCGKDGSGNHSFAGSTIISSLWKRCVWSIEHNHYLPVKSSRVQPQLFSPTLYSLTLWLISNPSPGLSSLLSEPLLSHLLVDLQPFSGNLLSDDIRTIPCRRSPMIRARLLQNFSGTLPSITSTKRARCYTSNDFLLELYLCITCTYCPS